MFFVGYAFYEIGMSEAQLIGITGHATVKMVRHYIETSGSSAVSAAKRKNAERNYHRASELRGLLAGNAAERAKMPVGLQETNATANGAAILVNAIQAVLAAPALTPEAKNAAIAAIAAANMNGAGSITTQNTPAFSGDKLPQIAL